MHVRSKQGEVGIRSAIQRYLRYLLRRDDLAVIASVRLHDFCSSDDLNRLADYTNLHRGVDALSSPYVDRDPGTGERAEPSLLDCDGVVTCLHIEKVVVADTIRGRPDRYSRILVRQGHSCLHDDCARVVSDRAYNFGRI